MAPGDFNGKDFGGGHTGMGWFKYNWGGVSGYSNSYPINADLVEGLKVRYIGKNKKFRDCKGVVQKMDKKYGRSQFPVTFEVYLKKKSQFKYVKVYCTKDQLQMPIVLNDKYSERNALFNAKKATRLRKKKQKRASVLKKISSARK
jgi:hypothetical protein